MPVNTDPFPNSPSSWLAWIQGDPQSLVSGITGPVLDRGRLSW